MGKNIVVITGSHRENSNSTAMARAFLQAAEQLGHTVVHLDAAQAGLSGCRACGSCFQQAEICPYDPAFAPIASALLAADGIVLATPVYWYSYPAQIKAVIDKLYAFLVSGRDIGQKDCALIACCQERDISVFDGLRVPFERMADLLRWRCVGEVLIPGVWHEGDIAQTDGCRQAARLAAAFS